MTPESYVKNAMRTLCDMNKAAMRLTSCQTNAQVNHGLLGIVKEGGEALSLWEKYLYYGQPLDEVRLADELGDVLWYFAEVCDALGLDIVDLFNSNIAKLKVRFPDKYDDSLVLEKNRDRAKEKEAVENLIKRHRTVAEVLEARANAVRGGCCDRFANNQGCDCLSRAQLMEKKNAQG